MQKTSAARASVSVSYIILFLLWGILAALFFSSHHVSAVFFSKVGVQPLLFGQIIMASNDVAIFKSPDNEIILFSDQMQIEKYSENNKTT